MASPVYDTEYVKFTEVKVPSKHAGERFFLKFYLQTASGTQVLAATAEDQGDAHYCYKNSRGFNQYGILDSHSRKDVLMWLEKIIRESSAQFRKTASGPERMLLKTTEHPEGVYFVGEEQRYSTFADGRRCTEWYLTDNHGIQHRAVVGEENHARDGHYVYRSVEPFSAVSQLECKNKAGVYHWLEIWIVHEDGLSRDKQRERQRRSRPKRRHVVLDVGTAGGLPRKSPIRSKLPTAHPELIKAQEKGRIKEKLMLEAINFCFSKATDAEVEAVQHWSRILQELRRQWDIGQTYPQECEKDEKIENPETGFVYLKRNFYGLCLEALREIGTIFVSAELFQKTGITKLIAGFRFYPTEDVARFAKLVCRKWSSEIEKHQQTLTSLDTLRDPLDSVDHLLK